MRRKEKELLQKIDRLEYINKMLEESIRDLEDFIKRNNVVCPDCGYSGLDCHNYQG